MESFCILAHSMLIPFESCPLIAKATCSARNLLSLLFGVDDFLVQFECRLSYIYGRMLKGYAKKHDIVMNIN